MNATENVTKTHVSVMSKWVLDWAVAQCLVKDGVITEDRYEMGKPYLSGVYLYGEAYEMTNTFDKTREGNPPHIGHGSGTRWQPSSDWDQAGFVIKMRNIRIEPVDESNPDTQWVAMHLKSGSKSFGDEPTEAAMRVYVKMNLGPEVDIPDAVFEDATLHDKPKSPPKKPSVR